MNTANKQQSIDFVDQLSNRFGGGTPTGPALVEALRYSAKAILLLSDGSPNGDAATIVRDISQQNSGAKEIHTVAIGNYYSNASLITFLQTLASQNGGGFVGIAN